jgi:hypothetical protein
MEGQKKRVRGVLPGDCKKKFLKNFQGVFPVIVFPDSDDDPGMDQTPPIFLIPVTSVRSYIW